MKQAMVVLAALAALAECAAGNDPSGRRTVLDAFEELSSWSAYAADGVAIAIGLEASGAGREGSALRVDFDFTKGSGYAVIRREIDPPLVLPENYAFSFDLRGAAPANHLEFKLIDESGENVWWSVRRDVAFRPEWETVRIKRRRISFAWGPRGGGEIERVRAIEIAITAGSGGSGTVWIDELAFEPLAPPSAEPPTPTASASSAEIGNGAGFAVDGDSNTVWVNIQADSTPWITLDLGEAREYGGLTVDWEPGLHPKDYAVEISGDGALWRAIRSVRGGDGGRDYLYLPETESRYLRLQVIEGSTNGPVALREIAVQPLEFSSSRNAFFEAIAKGAPRGNYPRGMSGEAVYWTVVGLGGDTEECLLGEDGAIEAGRGGFSIEPFLTLGGRRIAWSDAKTDQSLVDGCLPIPSVVWRTEGIELVVEAVPIGEPGASSVLARYRVRALREPRTAVLHLAVRPFQVNPPYQFLGTEGGVARIDAIRIEEDESALVIDGRPRVRILTKGARFRAATFDEGEAALDRLVTRAAHSDTSRGVRDPFGAASGVLSHEISLEAGETREVLLLLPLSVEREEAIPSDPKGVREWAERRTEEAARGWRETLEGVSIRFPESAREIERTLKAQLAYILVNRAGPAIRPGTRAYARSWIRDGALTSSALLRMGHPEPVREFIEWYAPHQYENGKIPCVVDSRGPDPVPEHDSGGEFIFLVAEYDRYAGDRALAKRMWPRVARAAAYLDSLRQTRRTLEYREPGKEHFFGLLPPSISHEGYSAKPMHSYWDDLWALRGFKDAAYLAGVLGEERERSRWDAVRAEFERELVESIVASMEVHGIDYVPGCADLGDFDATSTTIAFSPVEAEAALPRHALDRTFEKYWEFFRERRETNEWEAFTPYETRNIGAFVRLGWRERAAELVDFFLSHRRPAPWAHWAEVVWREERAPKFIGDMPHTWVGSDFVRSVLDMLVYARESDASLVVGAGIPIAWLRESGGVEARGLPTPHGLIDFSMRARGDTVEVRIDGGVRVPPGGIVVEAPFEGEAGRITIDGKPVPPAGKSPIVVREVPAVVVLSR
jgi:hypothetical protein